MRYFFIIVLFFSNLSLLAAAQSSDGLWQDVASSRSKISLGEPLIKPDAYRHVLLNMSAMSNTLQSVEASAVNKDPSLLAETIIDLPLPDGGFITFLLKPNGVMAEGLKEKFPDIRTYSGKAINDPTIWGSFDLTPRGFHGFIQLDGKTVYIDPYSWTDTQNYISYFRKGLKRRQSLVEGVLKDDVFTDQVIKIDREPKIAPKAITTRTFGSTLRTYRLAMATTGEYSTFHGGATQAMAAVVTTINRVTGIYENDLSIRFQLVANNDLLIYTDAGTDPYSNFDGGAMLGENRANIDAVIGSSNYDIGHVFSTGGGGVAYLGVFCNSSFKAGGVTGQSNPVGDPFDVDYVAHEIGHQAGANHTYNGNSGFCPGQRNASTAYEPGSGSTIMAYAGICSPQNLQSNSDAFFHAASIDEISTHVSSEATCSVNTSTGNTPPVANASQGLGDLTIPINTPFELIAGASDTENDTLTYTWEQYDLGPTGAPASPSGNAPLFRTFLPTNDPRRLFPKLSDLLNGTQTIGEILPTYSRDLQFRLTVRDGNGGTDFQDLPDTLSVIDTAGPFVVTSPNGGDSIDGGTTVAVTWNVANTNLSPVNCSTVNVLLSTDGGNTFPTTIKSNASNTGTANVTFSTESSNSARIKVACNNNIFFDISDADFTITGFNCSGTDVVLSSMVFPTTGQVTCTGSSSITASAAIIPSGADVIFQSNQINLSPTFIVQSGGQFSAKPLP